MNNYIAIMAGGAGTRFWPASRSHKPKQFLDILGIGKTLLQMTYERASKLVPSSNIIIVSNRKYKELILSQLPELKDNNILLEPSMNNTAPCVLYSALHLRARNDKAVFAVLPSDHVILKEDVFVQKMNMAFEFAARHESIVTLGIKPTRPDTGYGYINYKMADNDIKEVVEFKEKPDVSTAQSYLDSGNYLWNAGIFVWTAKTVISSFGKYARDILDVLSQNLSAFGTNSEQQYIDKVYPKTRNISVDFAILEKSSNVYTIPSDMSWSDLGTWNSLYSYIDKDDQGNVTQCGRVKLIESEGNLIRSSDKNKLVVAKGIYNYIIVDDEDVLLIYPRNDEQEIKQIRNDLHVPG